MSLWCVCRLVYMYTSLHYGMEGGMVVCFRPAPTLRSCLPGRHWGDPGGPRQIQGVFIVHTHQSVGCNRK